MMPQAGGGSGAAAEAELRTIEGVIERVTFQNEDNGWTVARLSREGKPGETTIVGNMLGATVGASFRLRGRWKTHAKFGRQFEVLDYEEKLPATAEGLRKYLGSGLIKGVGPVTAKRIVDHFGLDALEVIELAPERLHEVPGVGPVRVKKIIKAWQEQREIKEIMLFLQSHDITTGLSVRIYKRYGDESLKVLREDPYQLARDVGGGGVFGVGFKIADQIARKLGIEPDSPRRIEAGLVFVLGELSNEGHTFAPRPLLVARSAEALAIDEQAIDAAKVEAAIDRLLALAPEAALIGEEVALEALPEKVARDLQALAGQDELVPAASATVQAIYVPPLYYAEVGIANRLRAMLEHAEDHLPGSAEVDWATQLRWLDTLGAHPLAARQQEAVRAALSRKVAVLTGGPGTGKTTTVRAVLQLLRRLHPNPRILLAAPTGRAAKRLAETTGVEAKTIHRLLEFKPGAGVDAYGRMRLFQRHEDNPLEADLIVVDEMSMIDTQLMNHLVKAIDPASHLLLVGDIDQLPSVGPGNVLRDLIASGVVPTVALDQIFRQDEHSWIAVNAHRINQGQMPEIKKGSRDFFLFRVDDAEAAAHRVVEVVTQRVPRTFGHDPVDDIQVLSPMHRGAAGVGALNEKLQAALNPPAPGKAEARWGGRVFRQGDKVMQIRNNYDKDVFNGDLGRVSAIDAEDQSVLVTIEERDVAYEFHELDELVPAYAISTHKSQGAEYPCVVMAILPQHWMMLQRNLLYTGITRARKLCVLVGDRKAISIAVKNDKVAERLTGLARRMAKG
jgi:exodeoxyribonuclease V alpha subunit